ncbi:hypothetical protein FF1_012793 [Malus domestica]
MVATSTPNEVPANYDRKKSGDEYCINSTICDSDASHSTKRKEIVAKVKEASETWGFFQIVNHGIPNGVLEEIKDGVRGYFELDTQVKEEFYTHDPFKPVVYNSDFDLYSAPMTNGRDLFMC